MAHDVDILHALLAARLRIAEAERDIAHQRTTVEALEIHGHWSAAAKAKALLAEMQHSLRLMRDGAERLELRTAAEP